MVIMCGIAGIIKKNKKASDEEIDHMLQVMKHRGPDAKGIFVDNNTGLGHCRLSIVDLSSDGTQPMKSSDGRYIITFNGEIYNYKELRRDLELRGIVFKTNTDTEVLLESYRLWGLGCTKKFNGMWAFAIYDSVKKEIILSRDRFGVKPLYLLNDDEGMYFASEIKAILEIKPKEKIVDNVTVARYFSGIQEDSDERTFYKNIKNFPKATNRIYNLDGEIVYEEIYWKIDVKEFKRKYKRSNLYEEFLNLLEDSINLRLNADVEVGASLSGGLDSSAIVSIANKKFKRKINTFSSIYKFDECNEEEFVECVNKYTNSNPHYIYPDENKDVIRMLKEMIYYHDGPCESASPYSGYNVYKGVGDKVTVMLDGQGADELFGGYLECFINRINDFLGTHSFWGNVRAVKLASEFQTAIPSFKHILDERIMVRILGFAGYGKYSKIKDWTNIRNNSVPAYIYEDDFRKIETRESWYIPAEIESEFGKGLYKQLNYSILPRILHDVDRNSMANSLEVRLPFLDYRLVELSYAIDDNMKVKGCWTKYIMRKSLKKYLPKKIYSRRNKMGFPAPFDRWLRDDKIGEHLYDYIRKFGKRGIIKEEYVGYLYERHMNGDNLDWLLFKMVSMEMWLEQFIDTENKWKLERV